MGAESVTTASTAASTSSSFANYAQIVSTVANTYASYQRAKAEQDALNYQAQIAANNARISDDLAADALERGTKAQLSQQLKTRQLAGAQRASMAARGLDISDGSALGILTDTELMGTIDANQIRDNAVREAWGYRAQGANYTANAANLRSRASATSPFMAGATSLLTGAGRVASSWYSTRNRQQPQAGWTSGYDLPMG